MQALVTIYGPVMVLKTCGIECDITVPTSPASAGVGAVVVAAIERQV
jgi:hypothetical protein